MSSKSERLKISDPALNAVADAMLVAQSLLVLEKVKRFPPDDTKTDTLRLVEEATVSQCSVACTIVVTFLAHKYPHLFDSMAILRAFSETRELINPDWIHHDNFLARDKGGWWYAGSPSNYRRQYPDNCQRLTRLIYSKDLQEVLDTIEHEDEGLWPQDSFLRSTFKTHPLDMPKPLHPTQANQLTTIRISNLGRTYLVRAKSLYPFIDGEIVINDLEFL
ncbi:MAG: hypothetical protein Q7S88_01275 [Candidatus Daviesbacteria bacterium]|nr:hypothetical protein [Candidatus Daviesbacteria bacterium]